MQSSATHDTGATFSGGWYSADLAWMLNAIMQHQEAFRPGSSDLAGGLIQINRPTDTDLSSSQADMTAALDTLDLLLSRTGHSESLSEIDSRKALYRGWKLHMMACEQMVSHLRFESTVSGSSLQEFTANSLLFIVPETRFAGFGQNSMISTQIRYSLKTQALAFGIPIVPSFYAWQKTQ